MPERPFVCRGPRYIVWPNVAEACAPSLRAIVAALRDATLSLDEHELNAVKAFVTDGGSLFFGRDATAAMREAVRLQHNLIGAMQAVPQEAQLDADNVRIPGGVGWPSGRAGPSPAPASPCRRGRKLLSAMLDADHAPSSRR